MIRVHVTLMVKGTAPMMKIHSETSELHCAKKEGKIKSFIRLWIIQKITWNCAQFSCPAHRAITIKTGNSSITLSVVSARIIFTSEFILFQCSTRYYDGSWIPCSVPFSTCQPRLNFVFITFNEINCNR